MSIGSRMKERREELGMTQVRLAELLGVTKGAIGNYETGANSPKASLMYKVFEVLQCDANYLFQDEMHELETDDFTVPEIKLVKRYRILDAYGKEAVDTILDVEYRRAISVTGGPEIEDDNVRYFPVPLQSLPASAGTGVWADESYSEDVMLTKRPPRGTDCLIRVSGDSMEPTFFNGDLVFVRWQSDIRIGEIGIFYMDGSEWIKEMGDGNLISHNPQYEPRIMTEDIQCQGIVLGICDSNYLKK